MCASTGSKIKIGVFKDEDCNMIDSSKDVDEYLMDGDGYQMKLSHALLKTVYAEDSCVSCLAEQEEDDNNNGNNNNNGDEDEYYFLRNYELKLVSCKAGEQIRDPETGEYEYNAAIFRLCDSSTTGCDSDSSKGCSSGHGDYIVGLNSFVQAYFEDQKDNMNYDDAFKVDEYAECREYEVEQNDDANQQDGYQMQYFIGPACTEDGTDVKLELYYDEACSQKQEEVTFEEISNGWTMPFEDGGLVSQSCISCVDWNNGGELRDMCMELYEGAGKCETYMENFHYYGKQEGSCEYIQSLMPVKKSSGSAGKAFGWVVFILVVVGAFSAYAMWWKKRKAAQSSDGLMA
jgi:hypothetical protein